MALSTKIDKALKGVPGNRPQRHLQGLLEGLVDDVANIRLQITTIAAQLDLDATVTDTDYEANSDAVIVTTVTKS